MISGVTDCNMKCPYCGKVKTAQPAGKYKCTGCGNRFVILSNGKIKAYVSFEKAGAKDVPAKKNDNHAEIQIPSLKKILNADPSSNTATIFILVFWGLIFFQLITGIQIGKSEVGSFDFILATIISIIGIIVIIVRTNNIQSAFGFGQLNMSRILKRRTSKQGTYLKVRYEFCGREYVRSLPVHASDLKSDYQIGDEIEIIVDKNNPENVVILDPYR